MRTTVYTIIGTVIGGVLLSIIFSLISKLYSDRADIRIDYIGSLEIEKFTRAGILDAIDAFEAAGADVESIISNRDFIDYSRGSKFLSGGALPQVQVYSVRNMSRSRTAEFYLDVERATMVAIHGLRFESLKIDSFPSERELSIRPHSSLSVLVLNDSFSSMPSHGYGFSNVNFWTDDRKLIPISLDIPRELDSIRLLNDYKFVAFPLVFVGFVLGTLFIVLFVASLIPVWRIRLATLGQSDEDLAFSLLTVRICLNKNPSRENSVNAALRKLEEKYLESDSGK